MCVVQWFCPLLVYVTCDILVDSHCLGCKNNPWIPLWYSQICPRSNHACNSVLSFFVQCESTRVTTLQSSVHVHQLVWHDIVLQCASDLHVVSLGRMLQNICICSFLLTGGKQNTLQMDMLVRTLSVQFILSLGCWDMLWKCVFISSLQQGFVTKVSKRCAYHILYCGVFCACIYK